MHQLSPQRVWLPLYSRYASGNRAYKFPNETGNLFKTGVIGYMEKPAFP